MEVRILTAAAAIPGALTVYFSLESGGYFAGAPALVAAELLVLIALYLALARRPLAGLGPALAVAALALAGLAVWAYASSGWSDAPARALPEYTRALCYLGALLLFGLMPFSARRVRLMVYGVALAIAAVCTIAFLSRTAPDLVAGTSKLEADRLSYPLDYWNALGILAGLGIVLSGQFACAVREHWVVRVLGAAAIPLLTATLYYTFSRGAVWGSIVGVGAYLVVARPRGAITGAIATVPTTAIALMTVNPAGNITQKPRFAPETLATAHRTALVVLGCVVAAGAIRACLLRLDARLDGIHFAPELRRRALLSIGAAALVLALVGSAALHVPDVVADKYRTFKSDDGATGASGSSRFLQAADNGRLEHWDVALRGFERDHLRGSGAGTYQVAWARERPTPVDAHDGHSLYLETLGELGVVGLALLVVCLVLLLGGFARRARGPDRELFAALLAAGIAWALVAAVDWVWEMPAVTLWLFALGGAALARPARDASAEPRSARRRAGTLVLRGAGVALCLVVALLPARLAVSEAHVETAISDMHEGDCQGARAEATRSLDFVAGRAGPHHVIAWCLLREGHPAAAARQLSRALDEDPDSWVLLETAAVARASAGLDAGSVAGRAAAQNPRNPLIHEVVEVVMEPKRAVRVRAARRLLVPLPEVGDP
ncbi:MAG TPA: O-antigen ligase family protein [Thermoleophilaceae bacterium]